MPEASNSITIARPPADVFAFLSNAENDMKWRAGVLEMSRIGGEGVGATYHQVVAGPGGRKITADIEITELRPDRSIGFKTTSGPVRPVGRFDLAPSADGTIVTFSLRAELGGIKRLLMGPMVQRTMRSEVGALSALKTHLEKA